MPNRMIALLIAATLASPAVQAKPNAQPGEYEYSVKLKMFGMSMPATTFKQCVTQKDIDSGKAYVNNEKQSDCDQTGIKWSGNDFTVNGQCRNPDMKMTGKGTASDSGFEMEMEVNVSGDVPIQQKQKISAKRLGDCTK